MGGLISAFHFGLTKKELIKTRILLQKELNLQLEELKVLGVINNGSQQAATPVETKVCTVLCVRSDCVILSGGVRLEADPLLCLNEGDSVRVEKMSTFDSWKITEINTMDLLVQPKPEQLECEVIDIADDDMLIEQPYIEIIDGQVLMNHDGYLIMEPDTCSVNQKDIKCQFTPASGDVVEITLKRTGTNVQVIEIKPKSTRFIEGFVTQWEGSVGRIQTKNGLEVSSFKISECEMNYLPHIGDTVCAVVLENKFHKEITWRASKVAIMHLATVGENFDPEILELLQDSEEISIAKHFDCGSFAIGSKGRIMPSITNKSGRVRYLTGIYPCTKISPIPQFLLVSNHTFPVKIENNETITFVFECTPRQEGAWRDLYVFDFERGTSRLGRFFSVEVTNGSGRKGDNYRKPKIGDISEKITGPVIKSQRNINLNPFRRRVQKKIMPEHIKKIVQSLGNASRDEILLALQKHFPCLAEDVDTYNYTIRFSLLLHLEEAEAEKGMEKWNLRGVMVERDIEDCESFSVPAAHLTERRPSVLCGDTVKVQSEKGGPVYEGIVEQTNQGRISFKLHSTFPACSSVDLFNVDFLVSRTNFKFLHTAIEAAWKNVGDEVLFPTTIEHQEPQTTLDNKLHFGYPPAESLSSTTAGMQGFSGGWFNAKLNPSQRAAVSNILLGIARPMPYVIFGPPGTGKTVTLIETILQISKLVPNARILVATPSNSAADLVTELLISANSSLKPGVLTRLVAFNYRRAVPIYLQKYTITVKFDSNNDIIKDISNNKITVGTCASVGRLCLQQKIPYYSHVVIDEAGQASEPETMCAVALLGKPRQVILAGDPKQLGPVILGRIAVQGGLDTSWLARLLQYPLYSRDVDKFPSTQGYNPCLITMLTVNYRTVPEILGVASHLFYNNLLTPMVSQSEGKEAELLHSMVDDLPEGCGNCPPALVFHGLKGQCCRDDDSPSWYNPAEINQVFIYVQKLLRKNVKPWDIGIITFYAKQTGKMREILRGNKIADIKVGSVEEFQGQERMVMILSTVRVLAMEDDSMGFISSPNRVNVALTRAKALLIVVGDPHMLSMDYNWNTVLKDCIKRNAYTGCDLPITGNKRYRRL